jgi:hypothetical protein
MEAQRRQTGYVVGAVPVGRAGAAASLAETEARRAMA